jgi:hypothetical protein
VNRFATGRAALSLPPKDERTFWKLGEAAFREVLADPSKMPKSVVEWCEALLGVAGTAHERATGRAADFDTTVSYETGSNRAQWG